MERAKLKYHNDYLQVIMPDGQVIPDQVDIKIENEVGQRKIATAIVTMIVDISEIGEKDIKTTDKINCLESKIHLLEEEKKNIEKQENYWMRQYHREKDKTWYQKLFNI